ncbi:family 10 glycosylhydrolase [Sphaerisporangium sp. NPDC051017]|uniref:glycoside hydrolase family 10 protein n=1 Tax=Sphaerisporangium sp. NPDC051017 TaxID=3154636 RepID=UPI00343586E2
MNSKPISRRAVLGGLAGAALIPLAHARGRASGPAGTRGKAATARNPVLTAPRQMRGMWIGSVDNDNWPSRPGLTAEQQKAEFTSWLDFAAARRLNAVFVQVRPTADAFWPSRHEPWSQYLTGVQGRDPGYDPLRFMIEAAHARGLAFHAWFNPYRVSLQADPARLVADHPLRRHPAWGVRYAGGLYYNPGLPEVRAFVQEAIMDAVVRYDVDGVHFDDYFYPYPVDGQEFGDAAAYARHGKGFPDRAAWRRHNVDRFVQEMAERVREAKPEAMWGISPFGVWRNRASDPGGSATTALQSYDDQYADTRGWVQKGWLDYVTPQLYWHIGPGAADYAVLAPWWARVVDGTGTQLWIGQAAYRACAPGETGAWQDPAELSRHLTFDRDHPLIGGDVYYSAGDLRADRRGSTSRLCEDHYAEPALPPLLPRLADGPSPAPPVLRAVRSTDTGTEITFHAGGHPAPRLYAVYRTDGPGDPGRLIAVLPGTRHARHTDTGAGPGTRYHVTALDRANRQSEPVSWEPE